MILNGSLPVFDLSEGGLWLAFCRGLFVAAMALSYGTALFRSRIAVAGLRALSPAEAASLTARYARLAKGALISTLLLLCVWLVVQSAVISGAHGVLATLRQVPTVLTDTSFGHILILQVAALLAALALVVLRKPTSENFAFTAFATGCAIVAQAWHGHAAAMYDGFSPLLLCEIVHLLAASAWLGTLVPLLIMVKTAPTKPAFLTVRRYGPFGTACVVALLLTAFWQGYTLIGSIPTLLGTAYGWMALVKLVLFGILLLFAAFNRFRLGPAKDQAGMIRSIAFETGFGLALLLAAGILVMLPPGMHTQPVWPFARQFSLVTLREAPEMRGDVVLAALGLLAALALIVTAILKRRVRFAGLALAAAILWFAAPPLGLLFVEAYPTSFYHSTTGFSATSIAAGAALYPANCAGCHGADGQGDGPAAAGLSVPPADLTAPHLWGHSDGELFWWLTDGIDAPDGAKVMPPFATMLSEEQRWQLIDFIRARNAGDNCVPVQAPGFAIECVDGSFSLDRLQGKPVRLVFGIDRTPPEKLTGQITTVVADSQGQPDGAHCMTRDAGVSPAYALLAGVAPDEMDGRQFLIDPNGWLRDWQRPDMIAGWNDPDTLLANVREIVDHPLAQGDTMHAHHHHH